MHSFAKNRTEYHLNVFDERIMVEIIQIKPDFVWENHSIIVFLWILHRCQEFLFITVFQACWSSYAWT